VHGRLHAPRLGPSCSLHLGGFCLCRFLLCRGILLVVVLISRMHPWSAPCFAEQQAPCTSRIASHTAAEDTLAIPCTGALLNRPLPLPCSPRTSAAAADRSTMRRERAACAGQAAVICKPCAPAGRADGSGCATNPAAASTITTKMAAWRAKNSISPPVISRQAARPPVRRASSARPLREWENGPPLVQAPRAGTRPQRVWGTRVGAVRTGAAVLLSTRCRAVDGRHRVDRGPPASHCRQPAGAGAGTPKARGHAHAASVRTVASKRRRPFAPRTHPARGQHLPRRLLLTPNFPRFLHRGDTKVCCIFSKRAARWNSLSIFIHLRWNSIISFGFPPVVPLDSAPDEVNGKAEDAEYCAPRPGGARVPVHRDWHCLT